MIGEMLIGGEGSMLAQPSRRPFVRNEILASLSRPDLAAIGEYFEPIALKERMIVQELKKPVEYVYFVETGIISLRIVAGGSMLETAVVGHRGALGASFLSGGHLPIHQAVVHSPGNALRISAGHLRRVMNESLEIQERLFRYAQALTLHCAQSGLCGVRHCCQQRLACWLCLAADATDSRVLPVTQDYLSAVLGLRRPSVSEALTRFEKKGLIGKSRGVLHVNDRKHLELEACSCYSIIAGAYASTEILTCVDRWEVG
jgi:CRP-like cAMP-binding protein